MNLPVVRFCWHRRARAVLDPDELRDLEAALRSIADAVLDLAAQRSRAAAHDLVIEIDGHMAASAIIRGLPMGSIVRAQGD